MSLRTYTPLRPQRATPRRDEGRVQHERIKPKLTEATPEQERYRTWLKYDENGRNRPCQCGCGRQGDDPHHILESLPGKIRKRDHWFVVLLARFCHTYGRDSIHGLGSEAEFKRVHGVDLSAIAVANLKAWGASQ